MDTENLTRFVPACSLGTAPVPLMVQTLEEDSYVRFLDVKEASSNSLQKLKAEIAAYATCLIENSRGFVLEDIIDIGKQLRQLSAV